jgi:hypothetical protein
MIGGNAKTLMLAHISPEGESYVETLSTLKFAQRVSTVELGTAHANKESNDIRELKEQVNFPVTTNSISLSTIASLLQSTIGCDHLFQLYYNKIYNFHHFSIEWNTRLKNARLVPTELCISLVLLMYNSFFYCSFGPTTMYFICFTNRR